MSRFLFAVPPLAGHVLPTVGVGEELARRGHQVAWAGDRSVVERHVPAGCPVFEVGNRALMCRLSESREWRLGLRGSAALRDLWEDFLIPLAESMVDPMTNAVAEFEPAAVIADQHTIGAAVVARRSGRPWVTSAATWVELTEPLSDVPRIDEWVRERVLGFQRRLGEPDPVDLRFSDRLVICYATPELMGTGNSLPDHVALTGPALRREPAGLEFPWAELDRSRPRVLVSLGTVNSESGLRFYRLAAEALGEMAQLIIAGPDPGFLDPVPMGAIVRRFVPLPALMGHVDAVVCHAGPSTVSEALSHAVPLVVAPIRDDQPVVARQVVATGVGVRVRYARLCATELRDAVLRVLWEPGFRAAARRVAASFRRAGGAAAAASRIEALI